MRAARSIVGVGTRQQPQARGFETIALAPATQFSRGQRISGPVDKLTKWRPMQQKVHLISGPQSSEVLSSL